MQKHHKTQSLSGPERSFDSIAPTSVSHLLITVTLLFLLAVGAYSFYIAMHEPDLQETIVLGQTRMAGGSPAALRVVVRNRKSGKPVQDAHVTLSLRDKIKTIKLGTFHTDNKGSLGDSLAIPDITPGSYELLLESRSVLGSDRVVTSIEIQYPTRVFLTSDKPLYQPGQTLHLRTLTVNARTQKPFGEVPVTFEIKDPKGNKVFKETHKSSKFGIAATDFVLASELNLGRYEIRAVSGAATEERTVEVKRYVLPRFKIQVSTDQPYYLPGQTVSGSIKANYFFGRPSTGAIVRLTAATSEEKPVVITELQGQTDQTGKYSFRFTLPTFFVELQQKNELTWLDLRAELQDSAQHTEETKLSLCIAPNELELAAIPEAGVFVPGVENILYVIAAYPNGLPASCQVSINGTAYQSNVGGVTEVRLGASELDRQLEIQAIDSTGRKARLAFHPDTNGPALDLLLRTDKAVYQSGQAPRLTILSPGKESTVFIDVIKDNQTVLTRSVTLQNHAASHDLAMPSSLVGAFKLNAYVITSTGEDRGCSRMIYVNPASGLQVSTKLSKAVYRPGEMAKLDFSVTDADGRPASAALGISAVDESVFALNENRGLFQQFLDLEGQGLKPRALIKLFDHPEQFLSDDEQNQTLAQAYFSSLNRKSVEPTIDDLVRNGDIPQRLVEHARQMRGSPAYERFRHNPEYSGVIRLLEGEKGTYNLKQATGPIKTQIVQARRDAYFKRLGQYLETGFCALLFLSPVFLLIFYSRPGAGIDPGALAQAQSARYIEVAGGLYHMMAVLIILPLVCYPVGFLMLESNDTSSPGWILLGFEFIVVLGILGLQFGRILNAGRQSLEQEMVSLRSFVGGFLLQFVLSRVAFALQALYPQYDGSLLLLFLASIVAPLVVLGGLSSHVRRQLAAKGITATIARPRVVEILIVISILFILAGMLLPTLARSKSRSQTITLLNDLKQLELANKIAAQEGVNTDGGNELSPRIRRDFPETLLWRPELITDDQGKASLEFPLADSITTWRASVDAISAAGQMGNRVIPISVFQDFFVDLDLPISMSLGDEVSVPLTCYNYLPEAQDIRLTLAKGHWFESKSDTLNFHLEANEAKSLSFPIKVLRVGNHLLRVTAQGTKIGDAIEKEVRVMPTGERIEHTQNDVLKGNWTHTFTVPSETIPDSQSLWVKFYPSRFSEIVEGLESIFQAPYGCFEQTSSTTYPNVLVLNYLKRMGRLTPEVELKARKFINTGYQRLVTFEVSGGGFEWFGHSPASIWLTAYGVMEFSDMARVHPVDEAITERARKWLAAQQNSDGSWSDSRTGARLDWITPFVAWALAESGDQSGNIDKALAYLRIHAKELATTYSKALAANALLARDRNDSVGRELVAQLNEAAVRDNQGLHWTSLGYSMTYSHGTGIEVETTALSIMAIIKAGISPESAKKALTWLSNQKRASGTWGSTQATILAMRALLAGSSASLGQEFDSAITVSLNGKTVQSFHVNKENSDVMKQIELTRHLRAGQNEIEFRQVPAGELPFQLAGVYWLPVVQQRTNPESVSSEALQIDVQYDRTTLPVNAQLSCEVTVKNNTSRIINMGIVDLAIPPGFDLDSTAFEALQQEGKVAKFEVTGNQAILYLREISQQNPWQLNYSLRAKYPLRVQTPSSFVYEYYQPGNRGQSKPVILRALAD